MGSSRAAGQVKPAGVYVAAVTPHRKEGHEVDLGAALELIDYLCGAGVQGIAMLGSTGEFLHLTSDDRARLLDFAVKRSRVPIVAGVAHSTLDGTVALALKAAEAGASAVLVMPPYFFRYKPPEVREYYLRLAERLASTVPILLYNIPFFTTAIAPDIACELLATGQFAGIKDSSGDYEYYAALKNQADSRGWTLLVGNDIVFTRCRRDGADGVVSGVACAVPELMLALDEAIGMQLDEKVNRLEARLMEFIGWLDRFPAPVGVKEATAARGLKVGPPAVPLAPDTARDLERFRAWFKEWLPMVQSEAADR
ncbi:MAG: dihydrodipicolinate synthase family protein [Bryobacteraceae bacterium]